MPETEGELHGWKAIAGHLGVSVRTARNYKEHLGLPVHRRPGIKGGVCALVRELDAWRAPAAPVTPLPWHLSQPFGGHFRHVAVTSALYALLFVDSLFLEVVYQFDRLGGMAMKLALPVFLWALGTAVVALALDWRQTLCGRSSGLATCVGVVLAAAAILHAALSFFLPATPVTEIDFRPLTAQAAHLKNTLFALIGAIVFWLIPYHYILTREREGQTGGSGAVYLRFSWLLIVLLIATLEQVYVCHLVFSNVKPSPYLNWFIQLFLAREVLWFSLAVKCCVWYQRSLNVVRASP